MSGLALDALLDSRHVVVIPGLLAWLDSGRPRSAPDFGQSVDGGFTETLEEFCARIHQEAER